jgi:hypothetical protein
MSILLSHGGWGTPTVPIDVAVEHCARLGFDGDRPPATGTVASYDSGPWTGRRRLRLQRGSSTPGRDWSGLSLVA